MAAHAFSDCGTPTAAVEGVVDATGVGIGIVGIKSSAIVAGATGVGMMFVVGNEYFNYLEANKPRFWWYLMKARKLKLKPNK